MSYNNAITAVFLILATTMINYGFSEDKKRVETKLSVFPETVAFGDTCYVLVAAINHSDEIAFVAVPHFQFIYDYIVQFDLKRDRMTWRGTFECWVHRETVRDVLDWFPIPDGELVTFLAVPLQFPPLEDLYQDDFWMEMRKELKEIPEGLSFDFCIEFIGPQMKEELLARCERLTQKVTIKLRNDKEMKLIDQWYRDTPSDFFPVFIKGKYLSKVPPRGNREESGKKILGHSPWYFMNTGNRYPSDPNAPETWRGWKELEESLTPSTMRDEVRLSRIMIQYCGTEDKAVLKELKDWFDGMNEIQRTVMAKLLRDRAFDSRGTTLLPQFREIYKTIREYDIVPVPKSNVKHLRNLGLIE